jgi:alpha-beta hydrolase superfamily lysophospholipase
VAIVENRLRDLYAFYEAHFQTVQKHFIRCAVCRFSKTPRPFAGKVDFASMGRACFKWEKKIRSAAVSDKSLLIVQGTNDTTVCWQYNLEFIRTKFKDADVEFVENAQHEFFNEAKQYRDQCLS